MNQVSLALVCALILAALSGCEAPANGLDPGSVLGRNPVVGAPPPITAGDATGAVSNPSGVVGDSCHADDPDHVCLAVKYVAYLDSSGDPTVSRQAAVDNIRSLNQVWAQCNVGFEIESYLEADSARYHLRYQTADLSELDGIRQAFQDESELLVVTTGTWDRSGTLGETSANAWTAMPGSGPYGAILERPVGTFANIVAHELGHYLNLLHVQDSSDLMNPVIYSGSTRLTSSQCDTARAAAAFFWAKMYR